MTGWEYEAAYWMQGAEGVMEDRLACLSTYLSYATTDILEINLIGTPDQSPPSSFDFSIHPYAEC